MRNFLTATKADLIKKIDKVLTECPKYQALLKRIEELERLERGCRNSLKRKSLQGPTFKSFREETEREMKNFRNELERARATQHNLILEAKKNLEAKSEVIEVEAKLLRPQPTFLKPNGELKALPKFKRSFKGSKRIRTNKEIKLNLNTRIKVLNKKELNKLRS